MLDLLKLSGVLALIIALIRLKWNLGLVLLLASALAGLLFGLTPQALLTDAFWAAIDPLTLRLIAIVLLITFLGEILSSTLKLKGLIRSLGDLFVDQRWLLALLPMFIGLLPMVGGAMFSAPMVQEAGRELSISRERRTFINYWFRHSWEPIFPLYPSLVLAAALMGVPIKTLTVTQIPLFLAMLAGGILFGMVGIRRAEISSDGRPGLKDTLQLLLESVWPIVLVLGLSIVVGIDLVVSLLATILLLIVVQRLGPRRLWGLVRNMPLGSVTILVGAMVFRAILESSGAVEAVSTALSSLGIPLLVIVFAVPFVAGLLTGLAAPAFAIGFPIVLPLCTGDIIASGCGFVAYTGGLVGLMVSPMHLCLALTRIYFKAEWGGVYRHIVPAALLLVVTAIVVVMVR
jgi:integral membrane protein (TIGR00529 family)